MSGLIWELCSLSLKSLTSYTCLLKGPELDFVSNLLPTIPMGKRINAVFTQTSTVWLEQARFFKGLYDQTIAIEGVLTESECLVIFFPIGKYPVANVPAAIRHGGAAVAPPPAPAAGAAPGSASVRARTRARVVSAGTATGTRPWNRHGHCY